ncbi:hypothetical protein AD998_14645 [bacterium 336/3]|nr:hypothetical protein AD998_14645 [bacterium 336/3]
MKWLFFYLIILVPSKILGQCYEEISSSTIYIAEKKLFSKTKEIVAQEISDLLKKAKLGNRDTKYKMYHYRVKIDSKGNIKDIFFFKTKNINKKIDMLLKNYIQTLVPFRQSAYINDKGENISFIESFSIYIQIEENGITLKLPSQEVITIN